MKLRLLIFHCTLLTLSRGQGASTLTLGLHYGSQEAGDTTLVITGPTENLAGRGFGNTMSRYKIDGNEVWEFYDKPNFKGLLFIATGPIGWTRVDSDANDKVSSVRPVRNSVSETKDWQNFSESDSLSLTVDMDETERYFVRFPCSDTIWFKLFLNGEGEQNSHVELFSKTRGNIYCKKAGDQSSYGGERTDFNIGTDWQCEDDEQFMILQVEKSPDYVALKNRGNILYTKEFGSRDGNCYKKTERIDTQVWDYQGSLSLAFSPSTVQGQRGPPGEVGETGEPGEPGRAGAAGETGDPGENDSCMSSENISHICSLVGAKGQPGLPGSNGIKGVTGEPGEEGPPGHIGDDGVPGEDGISGITGEPGEQGSDGSDGRPGLDGRKYCNPEMCVLKLGKCYAMSTATLSVQCRDGYAAASIWRNTKFWGLKCCQIVGSYKD